MTIRNGNLILVPLTAEEEETQIMGTLQRSVVEKCTTHMPYFEKAVQIGYELQQRKLEAAAKCKTEMDATRVRGEGTSTQVIRTSAQGVGASRSEIVPTQPLL